MEAAFCRNKKIKLDIKSQYEMTQDKKGGPFTEMISS